jgi:hypothetical protein
VVLKRAEDRCVSVAGVQQNRSGVVCLTVTNGNCVVAEAVDVRLSNDDE